jgi:Na+-translocating ferredoxin:NAD+ oxidoreductase RnfC subunit
MNGHIGEMIRDAGVVGAGGAGLPTHVKTGARVDTVLVNGASCEPLLLTDPYLLETGIDTVLRGLGAVMDCTGASRGIICLKDKHAGAMAAVRRAVEKDPGERLAIFALRDFYPAGDEHVLVHEALGRTVPERGIPVQVGVVVSNVETLYNVALAEEGKAVTHRYLTVAGEVARPMLLRVPVGTPVADVLAFAGGPLIEDFRVVDGGPMMGRVLSDIRSPATKTTSGLIVLPPDHIVVARKIMDPAKVRRLTASLCCQCSLCTDVCPRGLLGHELHPHKLMRTLDIPPASNDIAREALLCSECGICEKFACPMLLSPREVNAQIKKALLQAGVQWTAPARELAASPFRAERAVPTKRLLQRLGLGKYDTHPAFAGTLRPVLVRIPLRQHIGAPANSVVSPGDRVREGDLLGDIPPGAMGAKVHASIDGVVDSVADGLITIRAA